MKSIKALLGLGASLTVLVAFAIAIAVIGSSSRTGATPVGTPDLPSSSPVASNGPSQPTSGCVDGRFETSRMQLTTTNVASVSSIVVVATFDGFETPRWNTPDGLRPKAPSIHTADKIYRPAHVTIKQTVAGPSPASSFAVRVDGGDLGCDHYAYDYSPTLAAGSQYVMFIGYSVDSAGATTSDLSLVEAWPLSQTNVVTTPLEGSLDLATLKSAVAKVPMAPLPSGNP